MPGDQLNTESIERFLMRGARHLARWIAKWRSSYGAVLLIALLVVTGCFAAATIYADASMRAVTESSADIVSDAVPSIVHLSIMQTRLHDVQHALLQGVEGAASIGLLDRSLTGLDDETRAFAALPKTAREQAELDTTRADLEQARHHAITIRQLLLKNDRGHAKAELNAKLSPALEAADEGIQRLVQLSAVDVEQAASRAGEARSHARKIAFGLDGVSMGMAVILGLVAFSAMHRHASLVEDRARELEQFASRVAHDIRGPLTPARLAMEAAMRSLPEEQPARRTLTRGVRSLRVVDDMVDGLLAFARRDVGADVETSSRVRETLDDVLTASESFAAEEQVTIEVEPFDNPNAACARGVLSSILSNLVRNAITHMGDSTERRVTLRIAERGGMVHIEVTDTGPGLPAGMEQVIFQPYVRGHCNRPGLGLGLSTVKKLCEGHGGKVGVLRHEPAGCTFWFDLPRKT